MHRQDSENEEQYHHVREYEEEQSHPITTGSLAMWIPIGLTTVSLLIALIGGIISVSVSNASRLSTLEVQVRYLESENRRQQDLLDNLQTEMYGIKRKQRNVIVRITGTVSTKEQQVTTRQPGKEGVYYCTNGNATGSY